MNRLTKADFNYKYICLTAYRTLLLLKYLMAGALDKQKIVQLFDDDAFVLNGITSENIRVMINSLKEVGCKISRPNNKNNFQYILTENPFYLDFTNDEIKLLNKFRKKFLGNKDLNYILNTNSLFEKICLLISNESTKENIRNHNLLPDVDRGLIINLQNLCRNKDKVVFNYLSGRKLSEFEMIASFLKYERDRLYIWGYSTKYNDYSYLRADKIKSFRILEKQSQEIVNDYVIRYEIYNKSYLPESNETIVESNNNFLLIDYKAENKFRAIQKFLELGNEGKIISPEEFKQEFIETVKSVKEIYKNE